MNKIYNIGLDISTSIIGVSYLDNNGNLVDLQNINLKKIKCMFEKSRYVEDYFDNVKKNLEFEDEVKIYIEEPFQSFSKGFSSAKTISQLNRINGIVSYLAFIKLNSKPIYINVNSARKNLQIKIDKKLKNTKEQVHDWVKSQIDFDWPEKIISRGVNKGVVKLEESCYDMSDAYVISRAGILINNGQNNKET